MKIEAKKQTLSFQNVFQRFIYVENIRSRSKNNNNNKEHCNSLGENIMPFKISRARKVNKLKSIVNKPKSIDLLIYRFNVAEGNRKLDLAHKDNQTFWNPRQMEVLHCTKKRINPGTNESF